MSTVTGAVLVFFAVLADFRKVSQEIRDHGSIGAAWTAASSKAILDKAALFFGYLLVMILVMLVVGQKFALPLFVFFYLLRWGKYNWRLAAGYAVGGWAMIVGFYDRALDLVWYPSWLSTWLPELLPAWIKPWLFV